MRKAFAAGLAVCLLASGAAAQKPSAWGSAEKKRAEKLAARWWKARPASHFQEWDPAVRAELEAEARAIGPLPEGAREDVADMLWAALRRQADKVGKGKITVETPYGEAWAYVTGKGKGAPLLIGLHGGGQDSGDASEARGNWIMEDALGIYPQAIRLVDDAWNAVHGERFLLTLIEQAKVGLEIDPDRVYCAGFSMGGTGSWFMGGRHADLLAGAAPCAGVLMASPRSQLARKEDVTAIQHGLLPNVRNLALYSFIGLEDRNCMPGTFLYVADRMAELREKDPGGYGKFRFKAWPDLAHEFPKGEPAAALAALAAEHRDALPACVVWESASEPFPLPDESDKVTRLPKTWFYWLRFERPADNQLVRATRTGNTVELQLRGTPSCARGLTLLLDERLVDPGQDVVVRWQGKELYRGRPRPDFWTVLETLDARVDRTLVFDRRIEL